MISATTGLVNLDLCDNQYLQYVSLPGNPLEIIYVHEAPPPYTIVTDPDCNPEIQECDYVDIPDEGFLLALIDAGIDINQDGRISVDEAEPIESLYLSCENCEVPIQDLTGLEAFVALGYLELNDHEIITVELNGFTELDEVEIDHCLSCNGIWLDAGELGDIYYVNFSRVNLGIFQQDANVVWDLAPHDISMISYFFDGYPVRVTAKGQCYVQRDKGIVDVAFVTLEYPDGRLAHIHVSWLDPNKIRRATIVGSRKMLVYDDVSPSEKIRVYDKGVDVQPHYDTFGEFQLLYRSGDIFTPHLDTTEPLKTEMSHFLDVIRGEGELLSSGRDGLRVVQVLEQACRSIEEGGRPMDLVYDD